MKSLRYPHIFPDLTDWPIYKVFLKRKELTREVEDDVMKYFAGFTQQDLDQILAKSIYLEKQRVKTTPYKVDPPNEMQYFRRLQKEYNEIHSGEAPPIKINESILRLVKRYVEEIAGHFNINTFLFTRRITNHFFHFLYRKLSRNLFKSSKFKADDLTDNMRINGDLSTIRELMKNHTVILVPTHSSNLDSVLIGYMIDSICGLPAFSYGAGLNLFDSEFFAFFMNRLGAYKLDRRKKNQVYLQTLNSYSKIIAKHRVNTIFFPGGTRSRSGEVETKLKLGLLGSMIAAQREMIIEGNKSKIIIVPAVLSYESVLEARSLMIQYLKSTGQEKFTVRIRQSPILEYLKFIWRVLSRESNVCLTFGHPMDVFGNKVNSAGESIDLLGKNVDLSLYYQREGQFGFDAQRESIYTKELSEKIVQQYKRYNYVLPAHILAYCAFTLYAKMYHDYDVFGLVQNPEDEVFLDSRKFMKLLDQIVQILNRKISEGSLIEIPEIGNPIDQIFVVGMSTLGAFHDKKVLKQDHSGNIVSEDFIALLYYSNKLNNLELERSIEWDKVLQN